MSVANKPCDIYIATSEVDVRQCWSVFHELRPDLQSEDELAERWRKQADEGYAIAYVKEENKIVAVAGYRFLHTMAWGHILYIDDLVATEVSQRRGFGTLILQHLQREARDRGCDAVHLDTGYQRHLAHRAYLRNGFHIECHHMAWRVGRR